MEKHTNAREAQSKEATDWVVGQFENCIVDRCSIIIIARSNLMENLELDALSLEYQRDYGRAVRNLDLSNLVNNPFFNCVPSIFGASFQKECGNLFLSKFSTASYDSPNPTLVITYAV